MDGWLDKWRGLYGLNNLKSGGCWIRVFVPFLLLFSFHFSIVSYSGVFFFFVFVGLAARKQFGKKIYGPLESNVTIANDMLARKYITTQQITRNDEQKKNGPNEDLNKTTKYIKNVYVLYENEEDSVRAICQTTEHIYIGTNTRHSCIASNSHNAHLWYNKSS